MNIAKLLAGVLMIVIGLFLVGNILLINTGHTSSYYSTSEDLLYGFGGLALITFGAMAMRKSHKKK